MRVLAIVAPYCGTPERLHFNARNDLVMIAPDRIVDFLLARGHQVVYCLAGGEPCKQLAVWSGLPLYSETAITNWDFDLIWHCVKDPTPIHLISEIKRITQRVRRTVAVLNDVECMHRWCKQYYYTVLAAKTIPVPRIFASTPPSFREESKPPRVIVLSDRNNDRDADHQLTVEFIDNVQNGARSFFRVPFCAGRVLSGTKYFFPPEQYTAKTGQAVYREPYEIPIQTASRAAVALSECGLGLAHIEGFSRADGSLRAIFDVNPFPVSEGISFDAMSRLIAERLEHVYHV